MILSPMLPVPPKAQEVQIAGGDGLIAIRVFPRTLSNTQTSLVLKTPKTKTSVRKIFLPSTVAQMLLERKKQIDEMKELFGDEYLDYKESSKSNISEHRTRPPTQCKQPLLILSKFDKLKFTGTP